VELGRAARDDFGNQRHVELVGGYRFRPFCSYEYFQYFQSVAKAGYSNRNVTIEAVSAAWEPAKPPKLQPADHRRGYLDAALVLRQLYFLPDDCSRGGEKERHSQSGVKPPHSKGSRPSSGEQKPYVPRVQSWVKTVQIEHSKSDPFSDRA